MNDNTNLELDPTVVAPPKEEDIYGPDGKLTHAGMLAVVGSGGSVMHEGHILVHAAHLPTEAKLAEGDRQKTVAAAASLQAIIAAAQGQLTALKASAVADVRAKQAETTPAPTAAEVAAADAKAKQAEIDRQVAVAEEEAAAKAKAEELAAKK